MNTVAVTCAGCGRAVDPMTELPFRCPAATGDDIDHVLARRLIPPAPPLVDGDSHNPFLRYRRQLLAWHVAIAAGLDDSVYEEIAERLDAAIAGVDGRGFRMTPLFRSDVLAHRLGHDGMALWIKDETDNVSGSHKARHLMSVLLYLHVALAARLPLADGLRFRRLAIASCGNAALAAAVLARAADWPLDVFIPTDAETTVVVRLKELGASVHVCPRPPGTPGDPCVHAYRHAVQAGALPFSVQGNQNGLAVEGGYTLGWELAEQLTANHATPDSLFIQVGGGALASGVMQGMAEAMSDGTIESLPRLFAVQTEGAWPLVRAWRTFSTQNASVADAARHRSRYMRPWESTPHSIAHGILDDETYDWLAVVDFMTRTGGDALIAAETDIAAANAAAKEVTGISVSATGSAGLAGLLAPSIRSAKPASIIALLTGRERS